MKKKLILGSLLAFGSIAYSQTGILVTSGVANQSGLKFANLTSSSTPSTSTGNVLTVNSSGEVILVPDQTSTVTTGLQTAKNGLSVNSNTVELGGPSGSATSANLLNDREIPMNRFNLLFSGTGTNAKEQITLGSTPTIVGKFNVLSNEKTSLSPAYSFASSFENTFTGGGQCGAGYFASNQTNSTGTNYGISGVVSNGIDNYGISMTLNGASGGGTSTGAKFVVSNSSNTNSGATGVTAEVNGATNTNYAIAGTANSSVGDNYGGSFLGQGTTSSQASYGIKSVTNGFSGAMYGGYFKSPNNMPSSAPATNYAIYAEAPSISAFPTWTNSFAISTQGDVTFNGATFCTTGFWTGSDRRFKTDIKKLENTSEKIKLLNSYTYSFKTEEFKEKNFDKNEHIGFIAQEIKEVFPQLVKTDGAGYLSVNYDGMVPVLLQAIKEQQQQIDELKALVQSNSRIGFTGNPGSSIPVSLSDKNAIVLNQNVPNPFAESTVISYNIPAEFNKAQIIFTTSNGNIIKVIDIKEKGEGTLNVFADDLSHGIYNYSLIVDGKTIDSKRMIKE